MSSESTPSLPLLGQTAIVTGASRGIGAGIAWKLASDGANVILGYTSPSSGAKVDEIQKKISALPHKPKTLKVQADLGNLEAPKKFIDEALSWAGGDLKVNILVNNAATLVMGPLSEVTLADYDYVYNVNVRGTILFTQAVLPYLQPKGRIVNLASIGARETISGGTLYCSSKAAVEGLTRTWAMEFGQSGITVNTVAPGPVGTDMLEGVPADVVEAQKKRTPVESRWGKVEEIADIVAWLASPAASWISGQNINASGGFQTV